MEKFILSLAAVTMAVPTDDKYRYEGRELKEAEMNH
jgi:hypothetical protein